MATRPQALIVDPDQVSRQFCVSLLQEEGFDCHPAETAGTALELLESHPIDLLVCGSENALIERALRAPNAPAVLLVAELSGTAEETELRAAGYPFLAKPIDPVRLGRALAWGMHARHLARGGVSRGQLEALYQMATMANSEPELPQALDGLLGICVDALGADSGSIMLATGTRPRALSIAASRGLAVREERPTERDGGVAAWVDANQRPVRLVGRLDGYPQFAGSAPNLTIAESMVAPIAFRRQHLGVLSIAATTPGRLGPEKLALVVSAADIAGAAIHRSRVEHGREHQDRLAVLGQLSASLAHELNNPLACVHANVAALKDLLLDSASAEKKLAELRGELTEMLQDMGDGTLRMIALTQNLKSAARKSVEKLGPFDLSDVLRRAEVLVQPQFKHRIHFAVELSSGMEVVGAAGRILQVVINLLVNAAEASERNGRVALRSRMEKGLAIVEVEDNGAGISPEVGAQLFEPFFTTKPEGTGLGLNISRQIALEHGGDLTFTSAVGKGTCFRLRLPTRVQPTESPGRPRVLVVDDEPALVRAMVRVLEDDFELLCTSIPAEAVQLAAGKKLDLILTDYSMPLQNGVSLIRALRAQGHDAPAALVTAVAEVAEIATAVAEGLVSAVIRKPWAPAALVSEVGRLVRPGSPA